MIQQMDLNPFTSSALFGFCKKGRWRLAWAGVVGKWAVESSEDIFALGHVIKKTASDENSFFANGTNLRVPLC